METTRSNQLILLGKIALAVVFLYSGWVKLQDPAGFLQSIQSFKMVPQWLVTTIGSTIPPLEILAALLLFCSRTQRGASLLIALLCSGFVVFYAYAWIHGIQPSCGCFGNNPLFQASPPQGILRSSVIGLIAAKIWHHLYKICPKK
jgi:uncharacterized membrane protein YphA (DoxX/SURF4 family)